MLRAQNLSKIYELKERKGLFRTNIRKVTAVDNISLEIIPGRIAGLLGVNGAGKTTMIKMLSTLLEPTSGALSVNQIDGIRHPREVKKIVNIITGGERNIYWRLTAQENLEYFGALYSIPQRILKDRIMQLLDLVGLSEAKHIPVEQYSKGMKQRLQIARGLINDPEYLFLDEPTLGLDITIAKEFRGFVRDLAANRNKGILLTTHYITEVEELCQWVYLIDQGKVISSGTPAELIQAAQIGINTSILIPELSSEVESDLMEFVIARQGTVKIHKDTTGTMLMINTGENLTTGLVQIFNAGNIPVLRLNIMEPRLEDALIKLSNREDR